MKKNLLIIVPNLGIGGQERVAVNTAAILQDQYNVTMVVFNLEANNYQTCCRLINLDVPPANGGINKIGNLVQRVRMLKKLKRELDIDISLSFGNTANMANAFARVRDKIVVSIRGYQALSTSVTNKFIDRQVYRRADIITCVAEKLAKDMVKMYHIPSRKVFTIYNPYDSDSITKQASSPAPFTVEHPAVITMGRLEKVKGYRHLLRAFALVQKAVPGTHLIFVGEGSQREGLENLVASMGLSDQVVFAGFQANPFGCLSKCDLYVLSSIHEGFPNALVEAMICGLPVVAADCKSGPREILTEKYYDTEATGVEYADYGVLTPPFSADDSNETGNEQLLADAVIRLLTDEAANRDYRQKSRERAGVFTREVYKNKLINIID